MTNDSDWFGRLGSRQASDVRARSSRAAYEEELVQHVARLMGAVNVKAITTLPELDRLDMRPPCRFIVGRATSLGTCTAPDLVTKLARSDLAMALRESIDAAVEHDEDRVIVLVFRWPYVSKFVTLREEPEDLVLPAVADGPISWSLSVPYVPKVGPARWLVLEPMESYIARWRLGET